MALVQQNLRCDVLRRAANSVGALSYSLSEAVVNELKITVVANHDVLGLEVTIYNILAVQVLEHAGDLGAIETKQNKKLVSITGS